MSEIEKQIARILIIDDDLDLVETLTGIIGSYLPASQVFTAFDGLESNRLIKKRDPDLIILDINLPSISGHEVCRSIKSDPEIKNIPILIITGETEDIKAKVKSLDYGAESFLKKPFDIPEFIAQVKSLLRLKRAEDELRLERDLLQVDVRKKERELEKNYKDIKRLFESYMEVMATSIDALSIYNYDSTQRVAEMIENFYLFIKENSSSKYPELTNDANKQENLIMAAWLHDIGKISIPFGLMNKFSRLGDRYNEVLQRLETIYYFLKIENDEPELFAKYSKAKELVTRLNNPQNKMSIEDRNLLNEFSSYTYRDSSGQEKNWLDPEDIEALTISHGTLTDNERREVENHVKMTDLLLSKIPFPDDKKEIRDWCKNHHELLDGSGYYRGLKGDEISLETRMLTIVDIFEALISSERPYKKHMNIDEALSVLIDMAKAGKLDEDLVNLFKESKAWQGIKE